MVKVPWASRMPCIHSANVQSLAQAVNRLEHPLTSTASPFSSGPTYHVSRPNFLILSLGSNQSGDWGTPAQILGRAITEIRLSISCDTFMSRAYMSPPDGRASLHPYMNAILVGTTNLSPRACLIACKRIERSAGRRQISARWSSRCIDIDIIGFGPSIIGWPFVPRAYRRLTVPHPRAHSRGFVLAPLIDVCPNWRHPVLGTTARHMNARTRKVGLRTAALA